MRQHTQRYKPDRITDIIIGMSDGFIIPFAITTALYRAGLELRIISYSGILIAIVGAVAMGLARYVAAREEIHEHEHASAHAGSELFDRIGLDKEIQQSILGEMAKDKEQWKELMEANALEPEEFEASYSRISAVYIMLSYAVAGFIPVAPYFVSGQNYMAWQISTALTMIFLLAFGFFRGRVTGIKAWGSAFRVLFTGLVAALAAYVLGGIFG